MKSASRKLTNTNPALLFVIHSIQPPVKPLSLKIRGPVTPVVAGEMASLTCSVEGARPAASIDWFNRSELLDPQPISTEEVASDGTFR